MRRLANLSWSGLLLVGGLFAGPAGHAFELLMSDGKPVRWSDPSASFDVGIDGSDGAPSGASWDTAFAQAMQHWNDVTRFTWSVDQKAYRDPCDEDGDNGVGFASDVCGHDFGTSTLALTLQLFYQGGPFIETDILFNNAKVWGVYSGPDQGSVEDFRRVATHELGHAMGLAHADEDPNKPHVEAIMNSYVGDLEAPVADDIAGAAALYGAVSDDTASNDTVVTSDEVILMTILNLILDED